MHPLWSERVAVHLEVCNHLSLSVLSAMSHLLTIMNDLSGIISHGFVKIKMK
jgi:hypothetical protein